MGKNAWILGYAVVGRKQAENSHRRAVAPMPWSHWLEVVHSKFGAIWSSRFRWAGWGSAEVGTIAEHQQAVNLEIVRAMALVAQHSTDGRALTPKLKKWAFLKGGCTHAAVLLGVGAGAGAGRSNAAQDLLHRGSSNDCGSNWEEPSGRKGAPCVSSSSNSTNSHDVQLTTQKFPGVAYFLPLPIACRCSLLASAHFLPLLTSYHCSLPIAYYKTF
ncbi:hypothetical protein SLEP1_g56789 [Rubroshorea leprosula]|uniref:Uncharacterized protein n=1 Tax=Rubroshorea leprosula TaxID=152421 RepID=A0AAV5MMI7_9ROSI|nr:hypothetical protein SLEP1_g56789 [Rubroshorea leprosula]